MGLAGGARRVYGDARGDTVVEDTTIQFSGEDNWDTIINHNSLDIEEETEFLEFCRKRGVSKSSSLDLLTAIFQLWKQM